MAFSYEEELSALLKAYAAGISRVSYSGYSTDYATGEDMLARIKFLQRMEAAEGGTTTRYPRSGLAGFSRE